MQVNRGGGILHAYYAKNSFKSLQKFKEDNDYEKQAHIKLTRDELIDVALSGEIGEAQWAATAALALLYEEHKEDHPEHSNTDGLKGAAGQRVITRGTRAVPGHYMDLSWSDQQQSSGSPIDPFADRHVRNLTASSIRGRL